ncbi:hypothetical protein QAD02_002052 [Eretmocerus hayati]|uniref:Uncharacterized protein n=1 Tax=Eretmocerus hayati TaxID=131215 RepID=A0ACC2NHY3_9HYME|nr:hypothetical protein QAD02_002052 [Eretmocerus hayati]
MSVGDRVKFQSEWLNIDKFRDWLGPDESNKYAARCRVCDKSFLLGNMGIKSVESHEKGKKHKKKLEDRRNESSNLRAYFQKKQLTINPNVEPSERGEDRIDDQFRQSVNLSTSKRTSLLVKEEVLKAEIQWALTTVELHLSLNVSAKLVEKLKFIFKLSPSTLESGLSENMKLKNDKLGYMILYGLGPYFGQKTLEFAQSSGVHTLSFDESFNDQIKKTQMDIHVRAWNAELKQVVTKYLGSAFLSHSKASDLLREFDNVCQNLDREDLLGIGMDGPNVNFKFYNDFKQDIVRKDGQDCKLVDLGSCPIHTTHNSFKTAFESCASWKINTFLKAKSQFFSGRASRQGHYKDITGQKISEIDYCPTRWVENVHIAKVAEDELDNLRKFAQCVVTSSTIKNQSLVQLKSNHHFVIINDILQDGLLRSKLAFFQTIGSDVEPFLREFQTSAPMVPFLHTQLNTIIRRLMERFVKKETLSSKPLLWEINLDEKENLLNVWDIAIGHSTKSALAKSGIVDKDVLRSFRTDCRSILRFMVKKLLDKSPINTKYPFVKVATFCDPFLISFKENVCKARLSRLLEMLVKRRWFEGLEADKVERDFATMISLEGFRLRAKQYDCSKQRLDDFWVGCVGEFNGSEELMKVLKMIFVLYHGNADVERGFSINKHCLFDNQREKMVVAMRHVYQAVQDAGGMEKVVITNSMMRAVKNSSAKRREDLESQKNISERESAQQKEKKNLKRKISQLENELTQTDKDHASKVQILKDEILSLKKSL